MIVVWPSAYIEYLRRELADAEERMEREFPRAVAAERKAAIDARLRANVGRALASACFYAWCLGPGSSPGVVCIGRTRL